MRQCGGKTGYDEQYVVGNEANHGKKWNVRDG